MNEHAEFSTIYARELRHVSASVRRLGVPPRDVPDVTHEVFIAVFRNLWKYDAERPFRPWLFGVLIRVASDHLRLARNQRELLDRAPETADPASLPDAMMELREQWQIIDAGMRRLDVRRSAVLLMHDFDGRTARDISQALGISQDTVFSRLRSARVHLARAATRAMTERPPSLVPVTSSPLVWRRSRGRLARSGRGPTSEQPRFSVE